MVVVPKAGTTRIEGLVGTGHQAFGSVVLPHLSQADGEGAVGTALAEGLGDRFEDGLSVRQVGAGQDADELVAAVAKDHVVGTEPLGDHPRQRDQQFVALRVPDVVVEPIEPPLYCSPLLPTSPPGSESAPRFPLRRWVSKG